MNETEMEKLFWDIFRCEGEDELHKIVTSNEYMNNPDNWYPYGGDSKDDRSNFSTVENQQSISEAALVEKITNSIDALLLKCCKREGIDPKSDGAPRSIEEATEEFFDIARGDLGDLLENKRTEMAREYMQIIATGNDDKPDLTIYDYGEGQHPDNFKNTFLSLSKGNKTDIRFVQGKYNMGSTGVLPFCGEYGYQLVASKMDKDIFAKQRKYQSSPFGWTLVRRHLLTEEEEESNKTTWYEYFAIDGEKVPQFEIDELDIGLDGDKKFSTGSFIKLFSYELRSKTAIWQGLYRELNQLLYKPALPTWLYEARKSKHQKRRSAPGITVYGNHTRLNNQEKGENLLVVNPIYKKIKDKDMGEVQIHVYVFNDSEELQRDNITRNYIGRSRSLVYVQNGQTHGQEGKSFISQDLGYRFLRNSLLVVIDCSQIRTGFRSFLFMANRSGIRQGEKLDLLKSKVIAELKSDERLRELNTQRKEAKLKGGDDKEDKELLEAILSKMPIDKSLANILMKGYDSINLPTAKHDSSGRTESRKIPQQTHRFPSIFKIDVKEDKKSGKKIKSIPLNGKGVIRFETDVDEDYFYRPRDKGEFIIDILDKREHDRPEPIPDPVPNPLPNSPVDSFEVTTSGPSDGAIKLTLKPRDTLQVGDEIKVNARLTSPDGDMECLFYVRVTNPNEATKKPAVKKPDRPNLPQLIKINKVDGVWRQENNDEEWQPVDGSPWDEHSTVSIIPSDDDEKNVVSAIAINMGSYSLKNYISKQQAKGESDIEYLRQQYVSKVYLHSLFLFSIMEKMKTEKEDYYSEKDNEKLLSRIFKDYSSVLVHLDINREIMNSLEDD